MSDSVTLAVLFVNFSFCKFFCNVDFLKNLFECFYNCGNLKLHFGPTFEILTFDFGVKFAKFPIKSMFFKTLISQHPLIGKFQNWVEIKVNYPTNKRNTQMDFSDNFHNIKNFVQVDRRFKISKNCFIFPFRGPRKIIGDRKIFPSC